MMQYYDHDIEAQIISQILTYGEIPSEHVTITARLTPDTFSAKPYQQMFRAILELDARGESITPISVTDKCKDLTKDDVDLCAMGFDYQTQSYPDRVNRLIALYKARQAVAVADKLKGIDTDHLSGLKPTINNAIKELESITSGNDADTLHDAKKSVLDWYQEIILPQETNEAIGVKTGFRLLDNIGGLRPQTLSIIGAYQGNGKTALAMQIALNASKVGIAVGYFSLEMSSAELMNRNIANLSGINGNVISTRYNELNATDKQTIDEACTQLKSLPIYTDDTATSDIVHISTIIRTAKRRFNLQCAFVDYLQIIDALGERGTTEENNLARICRTLKNLAKRENIAIVLLSQISRNNGTFEPKITHLRGSGQIAESADNVILLYTPSKVDEQATYSGKFADVDTRGTSQLTLAKCRNGNVGSCIISFDSNTMRLNDLDTLPTKPQTPAEENESWLD